MFNLDFLKSNSCIQLLFVEFLLCADTVLSVEYRGHVICALLELRKERDTWASSAACLGFFSTAPVQANMSQKGLSSF